MRNAKLDYDQLLFGFGPLVWRRRRIVYASVLLTSLVALVLCAVIGERYEAYTLLRVGQGIKERTVNTNGPFGDGVDLASRIDSIARIGTTDFVIRQSISQVGKERVTRNKESAVLAWFTNILPSWLVISPIKFDFLYAFDVIEDDKKLGQATISRLRERVSARQEGRSDLLRISFRHQDPKVAAEFVNELANTLVAVQAELVQVPGADIFFQQQSKRLEREAENAAADLKNFSVSAAIYSVADQRALLLKRANELAGLLTATRGAIEERKGQRQAHVDQLLILRPVTQSKTVSGIVSKLGGSDQKSQESGLIAPPGFEESPPLLLIRVYQEAMAGLLKINSDLKGSVKLESLLQSEIENVNEELAALSSKEGEYERLKAVLTRAATAAEHYATRVIEEQINVDIAKKTQLSSVRVVQVAEAPITPVFPTMGHLALLALVGGLALGAALILLLEMAAIRQRQKEHDYDEDAMEETDNRPLRNREMQAAE